MKTNSITKQIQIIPENKEKNKHRRTIIHTAMGTKFTRKMDYLRKLVYANFGVFSMSQIPLTGEELLRTKATLYYKAGLHDAYARIMNQIYK